MRGVHEVVGNQAPEEPLFAGYDSTEKGYRCKTQSNKVMWPQILEALNPTLQDEHDTAVWRKTWKNYFETESLQDDFGQKLKEIFDGAENANELPEEDADFWKWKQGGEQKAMFNFDPSMTKLQQSQTVCLEDVKMRPGLCAHLCNLIPDCEAFGTTGDGQSWSTCCFNGMSESVGRGINDWAQEAKNGGNRRCHRKALTTTTSTTTTQPRVGCPDLTTCQGEPVTCQWPDGTSVLRVDLPEDCQAGNQCSEWSDKLDDEEGFYEGNCRSGEEGPDGWVWLGLDENNKLRAEESGMAGHWIGRTLEEMIQEEHDGKTGLLFDVQKPWMEELAKTNRWTQQQLREHRWTPADLKTLPAGATTKPGCVRNITYGMCKAEASRLFELGKRETGKPYVDAFDYLWGRHVRTPAFDAYIKENGNGSGFEEFCRTSDDEIPGTGESWAAAFQRFADENPDKADKIERLWAEKNPRFDGLSHIRDDDLSGFPGGLPGGDNSGSEESVKMYLDIPADSDLKSACCLFKTPDGHTMRGAARTAEGKKNLWKRKCTVCLDKPEKPEEP